MTAVLPPLYSIGTLTFTSAGSVRPLQITMGIRPGVGMTPFAQNTAFRTNFTSSTNRPFSPVNMDNQYTLTESKILFRNVAGILLTDFDTGVTSGTKIINPLPLNTSVIVRKNTAFAGKQYRGRFLVPPCFFDEGDVDNGGQITSTAVYSGFWANALAGLLSAGLQPVILHDDPAILPTDITSFSVNSRIGTIGKRLRP